MPGNVEVLSTGRGHLTLKFDKNDPVQTERAKRAVLHMLQQGYVLFITDANGQTVRVMEFDGNTDEYLIADVPGLQFPDPVPAPPEEKPSDSSDTVEPAAKPGKPHRDGRRNRRRVPAEGVDAQAVGPSSGG